MQQFNTSHLVFFLLAGGLGLGSYLSLLALVIYHAKKFCTERTIRRISVGCGIALLCFAMYFLGHAAFVLTR